MADLNEILKEMIEETIDEVWTEDLEEKVKTVVEEKMDDLELNTGDIHGFSDAISEEVDSQLSNRDSDSIDTNDIDGFEESVEKIAHEVLIENLDLEALLQTPQAQQAIQEAVRKELCKLFFMNEDTPVGILQGRMRDAGLLR